MNANHLNIYALRRASDNRHYVIGVDDSGKIEVKGPVISYNKKGTAPYDSRPARLRIGTQEFTLGVNANLLRDLGMDSVWMKFLTDKSLTELPFPSRAISIYDRSVEVEPAAPAVEPEPQWKKDLEEWTTAKGREIHVCHVRIPRALELGFMLDSSSKMMNNLISVAGVLSPDPKEKERTLRKLLSPMPNCGMTMAFVIRLVKRESNEEALYIKYGYAMCSEKDLFNRKTGRELAMRRLKEFDDTKFGVLAQREGEAWYFTGSSDLVVDAPHSTVKKYGDHYEVASPSYHRLGMIRSSIIRHLVEGATKKKLKGEEVRGPVAMLGLLGISTDLDMLASGYNPKDNRAWSEKTIQDPEEFSELAKMELKLSLYYSTIVKIMEAKRGIGMRDSILNKLPPMEKEEALAELRNFFQGMGGKNL